MRPVSREVADLRLSAEAAVRADDWPAFTSYVDRLRAEDPARWPHLWAPCAALAAQAGGGDPVPFLREAIAGGFRQPAMLPLADYLSAVPEWPALLDQMQQPALPPEFEVTAWPVVTYGPALVLDRLPVEREAVLHARLPEPEPGAWATARALLEWATTRWEHANDHVDSADAVEVLDRADAGERFACLEYSVVLTQALNAVGIPARRVAAYLRDSHVGFGRGHVVSEAWIDDLGQWVVLDGQNGAWWGTPDHPLGLREIETIEHAGLPRPTMCLTAREVTAEDQDLWWSHFHAVSSSGLTWGHSLVPLFEGEPFNLRLAVGPAASTHPDLAQLETGLADVGGPALTFAPVHPFATGFSVAGSRLGSGEPFALDSLAVGEHDREVRTSTPYGDLAAQPLHVVRRPG